MGIKALILFVVGLIGFFGLSVLYGFLAKLLPGRFLAGLAFVGTATIMWMCLVLLAPIRPVDRTHFERSRWWAARVCKVLWILGAIAVAVACSLVLDKAGVARYLIFAAGLLCWSVFCVFVWATAAYRHHVFGGIPCQGPINNRFAQLLLVLLPMTGITGFLRPVPVVPWISVFFTILLIGMVTTHVSKNRLICLDGIRHFFGKDGEIVNTRTKMVRIMSTILVLCWVTVLIAIHMSAGKWSRLDKLLTDPLSLHRPLPEASRETYERVLSRKYTDDPKARVRAGFKEDVGLPMELHLASPEDLSALISERQAAGNPIREKLFIEVLRKGGHDVRPIILKALKGPNDLDVLLRRAKWKDKAVKEQLERVFEEKIAELAQVVSLIRKDPNSIESLIIRTNWGDKTASKKIEQTLEAKIYELSKGVRDAENEGELRSELTTLLEMHSALPGYGTRKQRYRLQMLISRIGYSNEQRKSQYRTTRIKQLITDANMTDLLEVDPRTKTDQEHLTSLLEIAGALAFVSDPQEAEARFSRVMDLVAPAQDERTRPDLKQSAGVLLEAWAGEYRECLFYRALTGVPRPNVTALLKKYVQRRQLPYPFRVLEFFDVFSRAGDRELAEWIFRNVAKSRPTVQVSEYPDVIPTLLPINISDVRVRATKRSKDVTNRYLEPVFPHLGVESIPLLLEHLDCDNDQLRAFIVWRMTSLGYKWTDEQLAALRQDSYWKVRLNALFAYDADDLETALDDQNSIVRVVAKILSQAQ